MNESQIPHIDRSVNPEIKDEGRTELTVEPRFKEKWDEFLSHCGPYAIALDGRVSEKPTEDMTLPAANFDHHTGVDRNTTPATCQQVYDALKSGKLNNFQKDGKPFFRLFVEDCDGDVSTCVALFELYCENPEILSNPKLTELVRIENNMDKSFGIDPDDEQFTTSITQLEQALWVYEPYQTARQQGKTAIMDAAGMTELIKQIGERIKQYIEGKAGHINFDGSYENLGGGKNWTMVNEIGNEARIQMVKDGLTSILSVEELKMPDTEETRWRYVFIKTADSTDIPPIAEFCHFFNQHENIDPTSNDTWGGSNMNFGSPRSSHSRIPPKEMERLMNEFLEKYNK